MLSILLADTQSVMRRGLRHVLTEHFEPVQVYDADTIQDVLDSLRMLRIDVILMAPDRMVPDLKTVVELISSLQSTCRVIIFSEQSEMIYAPLYLKSGAAAYLQRSIDEQELIRVIKSVLRGHIYVGEQLQAFYLKKTGSGNPLSLLTTRELEVLDYILNGKSTSDISRAMNLKNTTISSYKKRMLTKLGVKNLLELIDLAAFSFK